jgi:hypothetical protein
MPTLVFDDFDNRYSVLRPGDYNLSFLGGNDALTIAGGDTTTATMGDGDDVVRILAGAGKYYSVHGDAGNDLRDLQRRPSI